jgi:hypothetical protein
MTHRPEQVLIYHITDVNNLASIIAVAELSAAAAS